MGWLKEYDMGGYPRVYTVLRPYMYTCPLVCWLLYARQNSIFQTTFPPLFIPFQYNLYVHNVILTENMSSQTKLYLPVCPFDHSVETISLSFCKNITVRSIMSHIIRKEIMKHTSSFKLCSVYIKLSKTKLGHLSPPHLLLSAHHIQIISHKRYLECTLVQLRLSIYAWSTQVAEVPFSWNPQ